MAARRWMASQVDGKQPGAACLTILRKGAELGARDKGLEIRDASAKLASLCAGTAEVSTAARWLDWGRPLAGP